MFSSLIKMLYRDGLLLYICYGLLLYCYGLLLYFYGLLLYCYGLLLYCYGPLLYSYDLLLYGYGLLMYMHVADSERTLIAALLTARAVRNSTYSPHAIV